MRRSCAAVLASRSCGRSCAAVAAVPAKTVTAAVLGREYGRSVKGARRVNVYTVRKQGAANEQPSRNNALMRNPLETTLQKQCSRIDSFMGNPTTIIWSIPNVAMFGSGSAHMCEILLQTLSALLTLCVALLVLCRRCRKTTADLEHPNPSIWLAPTSGSVYHHSEKCGRLHCAKSIKEYQPCATCVP